MLIKRIYQADPLRFPKCGGTIKIIAFIEADQGDIIGKILNTRSLGRPALPRPTKAGLRPPARSVDARRRGRHQVRNRPRLPGICPPRRGLRTRFRPYFRR